MENLEEFKEFLNTVPNIKKDVVNGKYTWQQIYTLYGKDDTFFIPYRNHQLDLNDLLLMIKNVDLETLSSSLQSLEKILNLVSTTCEISRKLLRLIIRSQSTKARNNHE